MQNSTIERNEQTVRRLFDACFTGGDLETLAQIVAADYEGAPGVGGAAPARGPGGLTATVTALRTAFPDIRYTVDDLVAAGDRVAVRWTWVGTHDGPYRGQAPTHARVHNEGMAIFVLRDGKLVAGAIQTDRLGFLQQLGVVSPEIGAPPRR